MATLGQPLTAPETGWRRYDDTDNGLKFTGFTSSANTNYYNGTFKYVSSSAVGQTIEFKFKGTKLRIINRVHSNYSNKIEVTIDGNTEYYGVNYGSGEYQILTYEKIGLPDTEHTVVIKKITKNTTFSSDLYFDAIDIDDTGELLVTSITPATTGQLRTRIQDMEIGDYIAVKYDSSLTGAKFTFGGDLTGFSEVPITGINWSTTPWTKQFFYMIKVDKGLLISDRVTSMNVTWDTLNSNKWIQGVSSGTFTNAEGIYRSLTGGCAYADANGDKVTTNQNQGGWPLINEYDTFIVKSDLGGKITPGDDNVWHWDAGVATWSQDTPAPGVKAIDGTVATSSMRIMRGKYGTVATPTLNRFSHALSNMANASVGFRPAFEYKE